MNPLIVKATAKTPDIHLEPGKVFVISGRSIPEDPEEIFRSVISWIKEYFEKDPDQESILEFKLEYVNSGSSKYLLELLRKIKGFLDQGRKIKIRWFYEEEDEAILELGQHYQGSLNIPIELIPVYS